MQSLLDNCCYHYIIIDNDRYRNELMITNIGNFTESSDFYEFTECNDKIEDVTHIVCMNCQEGYSLISFPLKNLKYLEFPLKYFKYLEFKASVRNLSKINLFFFVKI